MIDEVGERQGTILTVTFTDKDGANITPSTAKYAIYDIYSGEIVTNVTAISPTTYYYDIPITAQENRILDASRAYEDRVVIVNWTYTASSYDSVKAYKYRINNYKNIPLALGVGVSDNVGVGESLV